MINAANMVCSMEKLITICPLNFFKFGGIIWELAFICAEMIDSYFVNYVHLYEMAHLSHLIKIYIFCYTILFLFRAWKFN